MLLDKDLNAIAQLAGIEADTLKAAITSEKETELSISKTKAFSDAEFDTLIKNTSENIPKEKYNEIKQTGVEMAVRDYRKNSGLEFEGRNIESLVTAIEGKYKGSTDERVSALEADKTALQEKITGFEAEKQTLLSEQKKFKKDMFVNSEINKIPFVVPESIEDEKAKQQYITNERRKAKLLLLDEYDIDFDENGTPITKKGGEIVKNDLQEADAFDNILNRFTKSNNFVTKASEEKTGGRGGKNSTLSTNLHGIKNATEFKEYLNKEGIKPNSSEADTLFADWKKTQ